MIKVKTPLSPLELSIVSGIDDVQANHIKFHNISFCCDSIEDCEKRVFIQHKKGKWIVISEFSDCYYAKCNQCNVTQIFYYGKPLTNYCPNCGADMREGEQK